MDNHSTQEQHSGQQRHAVKLVIYARTNAKVLKPRLWFFMPSVYKQNLRLSKPTWGQCFQITEYKQRTGALEAIQ